MAKAVLSEHLSQIPLTGSTERVTRVVTTNDLAVWVAIRNCDDSKASPISECVQKFSYDTPLECIIGTVADEGYVIVTSKDGKRDHILTYTDVIIELWRQLRECLT